MNTARDGFNETQAIRIPTHSTRPPGTSCRVCDGLMIRGDKQFGTPTQGNGMANLQQWIEAYYRLGWSVVPCYLYRGRDSKKAVFFGKIGSRSLGWSGEIDLYESLRRLRRLGTQANGLALKTGAASGVLVLDLDIKPNSIGGAASLQAEGIEPSGNEVQATTQSNGSHLFYRFPDGLEKSTTAGLFGPDSGVDLRGDGGLIFLAPSVVNGGGSYRWVRDPWHSQLTEVPPALMARLAQRQRQVLDVSRQRASGTRSMTDLSAKQSAIFAERLSAANTAPVGKRSTACLRLVTWLVCCQIAKADIWQAVQGVSKFTTDGPRYFENVYQSALRHGVQ